MAIGIIAADNPKASQQLVGAPYRDYPQGTEAGIVRAGNTRRSRRVAQTGNKEHNRFQRENSGLFGASECGKDHVVADALPKRARRWVFDRGATFARGTVIPPAGYQCGMLAAGFDSNPMVAMTVSPAGSDNVTIRPIDVNNFNADVERVWEVYHSAWERNWGFSPTPRAEFQLPRPCGALAIRPNSAQGKLPATGLFKILYYQRLVKSVRVLALGVVKEYRASGPADGLCAVPIRHARKPGYGDCEMSWILEDNVLMNRFPEATGAKRYKTYGIYEWN